MRLILICSLFISGCAFDDPYLARGLANAVIKTVSQPNCANNHCLTTKVNE